MKIISILLALVVINGHLQNEKAGETTYFGTEQVNQQFKPVADEVIRCLGFLGAICTMTKCFLPVIEVELTEQSSPYKSIPSAMKEERDVHFEVPGMFSVSIRE